MKHKLSQQQRMVQKMALTPQMRLSIRLLGMSARDLDEYIDSVMAKNPFLEKLVLQNRRGEYRKDMARTSRDNDLSPQYAAKIAQKENPRLTLLSQLKTMNLSPKTLEIAEYLLYEMDDNGYIKSDVEEVAGELSVAVEDVQKGLEAIQGLEPAGIGARDVQECLQLQLVRVGKEDSLEYRIVTEFIGELARNDIIAIAKGSGMGEKTVESAVKNIKKLSPRPALNMLAERAETVVPELVAKIDKRKVRLEVNRTCLPQLKLYNPYGNKLDIIKDPQARKFMSENMDAASKLIDSLKRREDTICKVAKYILEVQRDMLIPKENMKNMHGMKTLTLSDVAKALNFHPSTISRAVSNKYIAIGNHVIPIKKMLSDGLKKESGDIVSKIDIKARIAMLVKGEDKSRPLSDAQLGDHLKRLEGIIIKRRTVAKYRTALRILPAYLRKKL